TPSVAGVPVELWIGWALLWGAVPLLAPTRLAVAGVALVLADLVLMPLAHPVVVLDRTWLVGEAVGVGLGLGPGLVLGGLTTRDRWPVARAALQMVAFTGLLGFVLPTLVFVITGEDWSALLARPRWQLVVAAVVSAPAAALALQAVREFAAAGGTPVPLDPPRRLVTSGPYAYVANPMQLGATLLLAGWGALLSSPAVTMAAVGGAAFSAGIAAWCEDGELGARFGAEWRAYRRVVRLWIPSWRPAVTEPAVVHAATSCDPCREVGGFLARRPAVGLVVRPAEASPVALRRITYVQGGRADDGVAAIGRALEHVHLGWAMASWIGRLPGVVWVLQLVTDAVGGGPQDLPVSADRPVEAEV
ncbi:MAG TPA: methyltransferase, partial [Iamia sp.]|nr:methyltransferase [Iamia sp.]